MLQLLHIENIAVIEEADITFDEGFNALTGETGAGKSIVIDAMGAVLGQRTSRDLIRTGAAKSFVSAVFTGVPALPALEACGIQTEDGELLLRGANLILPLPLPGRGLLFARAKRSKRSLKELRSLRILLNYGGCLFCASTVVCPV